MLARFAPELLRNIGLFESVSSGRVVISSRFQANVGEAIVIDPVLRQKLVRSYYFAEALAIYNRYYEPLVFTYAPARDTFTEASRSDDRPPTWGPAYFSLHPFERD